VADWQCLEELDGDDEIVARYTYAPGYIDAVAVQESVLGRAKQASTGRVNLGHLE